MSRLEQRLRLLEERVVNDEDVFPKFLITYWKRDPITGKPVQVDPNEDDDDNDND